MSAAAHFAATPANRWLGFELVSFTPERAELRWPVRDEFRQEGGIVHGGLVTTFADTAAAYVVWPFLPAGRTMTGTGCTMHFLGEARLGAEGLRAVAVPVRVGRTVAVSECTVTQGDRLVARGTFTFLVRGPREAT